MRFRHSRHVERKLAAMAEEGKGHGPEGKKGSARQQDSEKEKRGVQKRAKNQAQSENRRKPRGGLCRLHLGKVHTSGWTWGSTRTVRNVVKSCRRKTEI